MSFNLLKPTDYLMEQKASHSKIVRSANTLIMFFFVFISKQTFMFALYNINWMLFTKPR